MYRLEIFFIINAFSGLAVRYAPFFAERGQKRPYLGHERAKWYNVPHTFQMAVKTKNEEK